MARRKAQRSPSNLTTVPITIRVPRNIIEYCETLTGEPNGKPVRTQLRDAVEEVFGPQVSAENGE